MLTVSTQCFPPATGGIETLMYSLCRHLHDAGLDLEVFADTSGNASRDFDTGQAFIIHRYSGFKPWRRRRKARQITACNASNTNGKNILLTDSWKSLEHIDPRPFGCLVCLAHGSELPKKPGDPRHRRISNALNKATYIIANSAYTASLVKPLVNDVPKLVVIHPGIETPAADNRLEVETARRLNAYEHRLVTVARLDPRKNHLAVIKSMPAILERFPTAVYIVIGDGPERHTLESVCLELGVRDHVLFTGRLDGADKYAYLATSDLFVMPGQQMGEDVEGFGMAYIEAGFFGLPAIATDSGGSAEAVLHGDTGLVSKPGDQLHLQENILELLGTPERRMQLGSRARQRSLGFLWPERIREYLKYLG